jgi:hypothetical protein
MAERPSIKGVLLELAVEALQRLIELGRVRREDLEARLSPEDLEILDQKIVPGLWYPIATLGRLLEITHQGRGVDGSPEAAVGVGVDAARRLFSSQIYRDYLTTAETRGPRNAGGALVRLAPLLCNFTRWSYEPGPPESDRFVVEVQNAREFPDVLRFIAQGCIQYLAERVNECPVRLTSERPAPDRILYTGVRRNAS